MTIGAPRCRARLTVLALRRLAGLVVAIVFAALFPGPAAAQVYLPSVKIGTAAFISPSNADANFYRSATTSTVDLAGATRPPEIVALARALKNDPDLIYQFVRNNIDTVWEYGLQKGALGASIDRSGTAFDQAMLMVELLRQAGYTATYEVGTVTLTGAQFTAWTNIADAAAACQMLSSGGIPGAVNNSTVSNCAYGAGTPIANVTLAHVWVKVAIAGSSCGVNCLYDPSYKPYNWIAGIDLAAAAEFTSGAAFGAATGSIDSGTASGLTYVHNFGGGALNGLLQTYATNLLTYLRTHNMSGAQLEDVVGGGVIAPAGTAPLRQTALPYSSVAIFHEWSGNVPDQYRSTLYVKGVMRNPATLAVETLFERSFFVDEIYGRRLNIGTNFNMAAGVHAYTQYDTYLKLDDQIVAGTSHTMGGVPNGHDPAALTIAANHPYAAAADGSTALSGDYMDATVYKSATLANPVTIVHGWGDTGPELLANGPPSAPRTPPIRSVSIRQPARSSRAIRCRPICRRPATTPAIRLRRVISRSSPAPRACTPPWPTASCRPITSSA